MKNPPTAKRAPRMVLDAATAADLMAPNPVSISATASVQEAAAFLADKGFSAAPVIDEAGHAVGVVSRSDIATRGRGDVACAADNPEYYSWFDLAAPQMTPSAVAAGDLTKVSDIMTPVVHHVALDTPADKVVEDMLAKKVHRLFVLDASGVLVGTVSTMDVLRHLRPEKPSRR